MESQTSRDWVNVDVGVGVCPHSLVCWDVGRESGCDTPLVEGKSVLVAGKAQPFLDKSSGCGHWIGGISPLECHGSFLVQLGVKEAGQNGDLWIGCVGGKGDGEGL